ncbi:hypothetical protein ACG04R_10130 [Roseateles sp. BYS78W]|uniref:Uncharacterized protein n=1 Tax=Pelomonas candidula TaxID=3299025 RepID=A0ABW7HAT5_9BURK
MTAALIHIKPASQGTDESRQVQSERELSDRIGSAFEAESGCLLAGISD